MQFAPLPLLIIFCKFSILRFNFAMEGAANEIIDDAKMREMFKQIANLTGNKVDWKEVDEGKQQGSDSSVNDHLETAELFGSLNPADQALQQQKPGKIIIFSNTSARSSNTIEQKAIHVKTAKKGMKIAKNEENKLEKTNQHIHLIGKEKTRSEEEREQDSINSLVGKPKGLPDVAEKLAIQKGNLGELKTNNPPPSTSEKGNLKPIKADEPNKEEIARMDAERKQKWQKWEKLQKLQRKQKLQNDAAMTMRSVMKEIKSLPPVDDTNQDGKGKALSYVQFDHGSSIGEDFCPREGSTPSLPSGTEPIEKHKEKSMSENEELNLRNNDEGGSDDIRKKQQHIQKETQREHCITQIGLLLNALQRLNKGVSESELPGLYANLLFGQMEQSERDLLYWRIDTFLLTKAIQRKWATYLSPEKTVGKSGKRRGRNEKQKKQTVTTQTAAATNDWTDEQLEELRKLAEDLLSTYGLKEAKMVINQEIIERITDFWVALKGDNRERVTTVSEGHEDGVQETAAKLWTEVQSLNLEAMKTLLLGKNLHGNALVKAFEQRLFPKEEDEALFMAKKRMRHMFGERMFAELELQKPFLLRLDLRENKQLLYKQIFSAPIKPNNYNIALLELEIRTVYIDILCMASRKSSSEKIGKKIHYFWEKNVKELHNHWENNVAKLCADGEGVSKESLVNVLNELKNWSKILAKKLNFSYVDVEKILRVADGRMLDRFYKQNDNLFRQFLNETPGARARVYNLLGSHTPDALLHFDLDESAMLDQAINNYISAVSASKSDTRMRAHLSANLLIQMHWLDAHIHATETKQSWQSHRDFILLLVDHFVDANEEDLLHYDHFCNNFLFGLIQIIENNQHERVQQFFHLFEESKQKLKLSKISESKSLFALKQANWLPKEHLKVLKQMFFQQQKEKEVAAAADSSEAVKRLRALNPEKVKQLAELLTGENAHQREVKPEEIVELFKMHTESANLANVIDINHDN